MAFVITLGFATEHNRDAFIERTLPRIRGHQADPMSLGDEGGSLHTVGVGVTSQSAARDVCHQIVAFLAHTKSVQVNAAWLGADGEPQYGTVTAGAAREAETLAVRVGAAAKARLDAEKPAEQPG